MKKKKEKKLKKNMFYKILSILLIISSIAFLGFLSYIDLLPTKYLVVIFILVLIFNIFNIFLINLKRLKVKIKKIISIFMIIAILVMSIISFYMGKTLGVLLNNGDSKYKLGTYSVIVLNNSKYDKLKDIKGEEVGYFKNSTGSKDAKSKLKEEVNVDFKAYSASDDLINDLMNSKINVIVIENSLKDIMKEEADNFESLTKVIYTFTIKTQVETTLKEVDVTKESFALYISGIDTYGQISSVSRSDVNMVMIVNPEINQILLVSIPRDYYVQLHGTSGTKDKLTHAGIYGIDMSIQTIEDLLEIDINYYIKVNFTSVIDIVDALGGLDVYSEYTFTSYSGFTFKKGLNLVNGEQALDFARTRKAFKDGDRQRGKNQQAVIEAIIRKATDKSIITKYNSLLNAIDGKYQTNMNMKKITSLIKKQLDDMPSWTVTSYSLTGQDSNDYTYTYNQLLYVMKPDENSVNEAIQLIDSVFEDKKLNTSFNDVSGVSNKVTKVQKPVTKPPTTQNKPVEKEEQNNNENLKPETKEDVVEEDLESEEKLDDPEDKVDNDKTIEEDNSEIKDKEISEDPIDSIIPEPEN